MMKVILEQGGESKELDRRDVMIMLKGQNMLDTLWDYNIYLRHTLKYDDGLTPEESKALEKVRAKFFEIMEDNHINLDELVF